MLYERLLGKNDAGIEVAGPIGVEFFHALLTEVARGELTGAEALRCIADVTTLPLDAGEVSEAQTLLQSVDEARSAP